MIDTAKARLLAKAQTPNVSAVLIALADDVDVLRANIATLREALGDTIVHLEIEKLQHDETRGYRQHAEQERDELLAMSNRPKSSTTPRNFYVSAVANDQGGKTGMAVGGMISTLELPQEERERLGRVVRQVWVGWAQEQPILKPSWLLPWELLREEDREVDRRIGETLYQMGRTDEA